MEWSQAEIEQTITDIRRRASVDPEFRALALRDPKAALRQVNSKPVPENFKLRFIENSGAHMTVILPDPVSSDGALNEADLELVSGGGDVIKARFTPLNPNINLKPGPLG